MLRDSGFLCMLGCALLGCSSGPSGNVDASEPLVPGSIVPSGTDADLHGVHEIYDGTKIATYVVGARGTILYSIDLVSWRVQNSGTTRTLYGVGRYLPDPDHIYAVGEAGTILRARALDANAPWNLVNSGTSADLHAVAGWIVGQGGAVLSSLDKGASFAPIPNSIKDDLFFAGEYFYVGGQGGGIFQTMNNGATWARDVTGTTSSVRAISAKQFSVAVGDHGTALRFDGDWHVVATGTDVDLIGVSWLSARGESDTFYLAALGNDGSSLNSCCRADAWTYTPPRTPYPARLNAVAWKSPGSRVTVDTIAVGDRGLIVVDPFVHVR